MLATERGGMAGRVHDLERKVLEQGDELVCLRATLADVLRRLNLLEGLRVHHNGTSTAPGTPVRNGYNSGSIGNLNAGINGRNTNNTSHGKELRLRHPSYRSPDTRDSAKRISYNNSALPQVGFCRFFIDSSISSALILID